MKTMWNQPSSFLQAQAFWLEGPPVKDAQWSNKTLPMLLWFRVFRELFRATPIRDGSVEKWLSHERDLVKKGIRTVFKVGNETFIPLEIICSPSNLLEKLGRLEWVAENVSSSPRRRKKTTIENLKAQCGSDVVASVRKTLKSDTEYFKLGNFDGEKYSSELSLVKLVSLVEEDLLDVRHGSKPPHLRRPVARSVLRKAISGLVRAKRGAPRKKLGSEVSKNSDVSRAKRKVPSADAKSEHLVPNDQLGVPAKKGDKEARIASPKQQIAVGASARSGDAGLRPQTLKA